MLFSRKNRIYDAKLSSRLSLLTCIIEDVGDNQGEGGGGVIQERGGGLSSRLSLLTCIIEDNPEGGGLRVH